MAQNQEIVIKKVIVHEWSGLSDAARVLKKSKTQIRRHVSGEKRSARMEKAMQKHGIRVEVAV